MNLKILKTLITANFIASVVVLLVGGLSTVTDYSVFEFNVELYGEFMNDLKFTMIYLSLTEMLVCVFCYFRKKYQIMMWVGFFLLSMIGSMALYSEANDLEMDPNLPLFFLYTGLSHVVFGLMHFLERLDAVKKQDL